jgi:uncharacterized repeat protein (TIGR01451 family)
MAKTAPRARSRAAWLGLLLVSALSLGQIGAVSAHADEPMDPPRDVIQIVDEATDAAPVVPEPADGGSSEVEPAASTETDADITDTDTSVTDPALEDPAADPSAASDETLTAAGDAGERPSVAATPAAGTTGPDLEVTKTSNAVGVQHRGDRFTYTIEATNAGTERVTGVEIHDELPAGLDVLVPPLPSFQGSFCTVASSFVPPGIPVTTVDCGPKPLDGGASATVEIDVRVNGDVCGTISNTVDVSGSNEPAGNVGAENHAETTDDVACVPRIRLQTGGPSLAHVGDRVTYSFRVVNTGALDLDTVEIDDPLCDRATKVTARGNGDAILSPGERWSFSCPHTITVADGDDLHGVASVHASYEGGTVADADGHDLGVIHPDIAIVASASSASGAAGTSITYTFAVTNTGDTRLRGVSVDDVHGRVGTIPSLAPGGVVELTTTATLGSSPVSNLATASGSDALGRSVRASDAVTVAVVSAGGAGGTPFTGAETGSLTAAIALLTLSGLGLILATRRPRRTA